MTKTLQTKAFENINHILQLWIMLLNRAGPHIVHTDHITLQTENEDENKPMLNK